uniref:Uncharacterized protein n=1 Tax=Caenorhabditis japonica TaxID=281687 RepID=A0A8R1E5V7_CAEJA
MKNVLNELKLEQKKLGNVTIANMEIFYEMCIDTTNCIDSIYLPDFFRGLLNFGTLFLRSACEDYGFKVGPFSKCFTTGLQSSLKVRNDALSLSWRTS